MESVGESNLKQQRLSPTYVRVRRCVPQIAQMNTDIGIYKICEYLWNPWENKSQAAEGISHRYRRLTRILGAKENTNLYNYTNINLKVIKICENPWNPWENNLKMQMVAPTDIADEHGYWVRRCFPQIAHRSTDIGIYKICEYLWNLWENQISSSRGYLPHMLGCEGVFHR